MSTTKTLFACSQSLSFFCPDLADVTHQRKPGGEQKGKLSEMTDKLFFIVHYYKAYPTFDVLGHRFGLARSKAHTHVHQLSPILQQTL